MATQIKSTVLDILQIISDYRGESSVNSNASRIRAVSRANGDFAGRSFWHFYLLPDQSMAGNGTADYTIGDATHPMRPKGLTDIRVGGTTDAYKYIIVNEQTFREQKAGGNESNYCYEWYDSANDIWKVKLSISPTASDTIYYSYYWLPPTVTTTTDPVITPNANIQAMLALADIYFAEGEYTLSDNLKVEAEQLIVEELGIDTAPAINQYLTMPVYKANGIGLY